MSDRLNEIVDRLKADPKHEKSLGRLRAFCKDEHGQDLACLPPDGLDPPKIVAAKAALEPVGLARAIRGPFKDYLTVEEWQAKSKPKAPPSDPSIGILYGSGPRVPLVGGISQDSAGIDWSSVTVERMAMVLHGREVGLVDKDPGTSLRRQWARELATGEPGDWGEVRKAYDALPPSDKARLDKMLEYRAPSRRSSTPEDAAGPCAADGLFGCPGIISGGGKCARPGEIGRCRRRIPEARGGDELLSGPSRSGAAVSHTAAPLVYFVLDPADRWAYESVKKHMAYAIRQGSVEVLSTVDIPAGANVGAVVIERMHQAKVVAFLWSADAQSSQWDRLQQAIALQVRIVPVLVSPCDYSCFAGRNCLPTVATWIADARNKDAILLNVASELIRVATAPER